MAQKTTNSAILTRRSVIAAAAIYWALPWGARAQGPATAKLKRIKMATVAVPDVVQAALWYSTWLSYIPRGLGKVSKELALSWGTPAMAGRDQILLQPESETDVFVRLVSIDAVPNYVPLRGYGWSAIEIAVQDVDTLQTTLEKSPVRIIGRAAALGPGSPIRAMQVVGPGGEVIYLTSHTGDRAASNHPEITSPIDRPFIMVLAGPDVAAMKAFYRDTFLLGDQGDFAMPVSVLSDALKLPATHVFSLSVLVLAERGNKLEIDGLPTPGTARPRNPGQLPPGVAITSFSVASLDDIAAPFIVAPRALYSTTRAASVLGPAGEIIELIEDRRG